MLNISHINTKYSQHAPPRSFGSSLWPWPGEPGYDSNTVCHGISLLTTIKPVILTTINHYYLTTIINNTLWLFNIAMVKPIEIDGLPSYKMDGFSTANCYITRWYHLTSGKRLPFANWKIAIVEWVNQLYISMAMFKFANCACLPEATLFGYWTVLKATGNPEVSSCEIIYRGFSTAILPDASHEKGKKKSTREFWCRNEFQSMIPMTEFSPRPSTEICFPAFLRTGDLKYVYFVQP